MLSPVGSVLRFCESVRLCFCMRWWLYAIVVSSYCLSVNGSMVMEGVELMFMGVEVAVMCLGVVSMTVEVVVAVVQVSSGVVVLLLSNMVVLLVLSGVVIVAEDMQCDGAVTDV